MTKYFYQLVLCSTSPDKTTTVCITGYISDHISYKSEIHDKSIYASEFRIFPHSHFSFLKL